MNEKLPRKVSPPFEGGVVGTIDYLIFRIFYLPTGVVDSLISSTFIFNTLFENRLVFPGT